MGVKIIVDESKCDLCGLCIELCPTMVFKHGGNRVLIDESKCIECYACIPLCPRRAIEIAEY